MNHRQRLSSNLGPVRFDRIVRLPKSWLILVYIIAGLMCPTFIWFVDAVVFWNLPNNFWGVTLLIASSGASLLGCYTLAMLRSAEARLQEEKFQQRLAGYSSLPRK